MNGEMQNQVAFNSEEETKTLKSTRLICKRPEFSDYDFIRLFFALIYKKGQFSFDRNMLKYQLYGYYHMEEYRQLFQDIAVKQQIEGNFLDIEDALQNAVLYGLINSFDSQPVDNKRLIFIDKEYCEEILHSYSDDYVNKMDCLTDLYLEDLLLNKEKIKNM